MTDWTTEQYFSVADVAERFAISKSTVRRMIARGEIEAHRFGAYEMRISSGSIARFLSDNSTTKESVADEVTS